VLEKSLFTQEGFEVRKRVVSPANEAHDDICVLFWGQESNTAGAVHHNETRRKFADVSYEVCAHPLLIIGNVQVICPDQMCNITLWHKLQPYNEHNRKGPAMVRLSHPVRVKLKYVFKTWPVFLVHNGVV
jgi:hypothetical protein